MDYAFVKAYSIIQRTVTYVVVVFLLALEVEVDELVIPSLTMVLKVVVMVAPSALVVLEITRVSPSC